MTLARLRSPADRVGFFTRLQELVDARVPWSQVDWQVASEWQPLAPLPVPPIVVRLPTAFVAVAKAVLLHTDADRFMRLHKVAAALLDAPSTWGDVLAPEHVHLRSLERQVRRDLHKMRAFVRFNRVDVVDDAEIHHDAPNRSISTRYVAWFEPRFHIIEAAAPFFMRRFTGMHWAILTPKGCAQWDGAQLAFAPPARASDAPPPDTGEALWLTYYERIFNPARVKVNAMKKEMPTFYWKNLPEARLIAPLLAAAGQRTEAMLRQADADASPALPPQHTSTCEAPRQLRLI